MMTASIGCDRNGKDVSAPQVDSSEAVRVEKNSQLSRLLDVGEADVTAAAREVVPRFRNIAGRSPGQIDFHRFSDAVPNRFFLPEVMGGGVAWFDFDGDGLSDLYAVDGCELWPETASATRRVNRLFRNVGSGQFLDVTGVSGAGDSLYGQGCAVGDFNSDGFPDLYVTNYGRNTLLANNGDGTFEDVTASAGVACEAWSSSAVWYDANSDGLADLYTVNYLNVTRENHQSCQYSGIEGYCGPGQWEGVADLLYLNRGDGGFQTAAIADELDHKMAKGLAVAVADFDLDRSPDVYVANDMAPNYLLKSKNELFEAEPPLYQNVSVIAGCAVSNEGRNEASMGVACADFDGDGLVDIFLTHFYEDKNTLYRNLGSLLFEDASKRSRVAATSYDKLGFGTVAFDANLDGYEDIFIANGHVLGPNLKPNEMTAQLLINDGEGVFRDLSSLSGDYFLQPCLGRGVAGGDFDNDGRLDLAVNHLDLPLAVLHNETVTEHHFIGLELLPTDRVIPAGGQVVVTTERGRRVFPIVAGGSYLSTNDPRFAIGLGTHSGPVDVQVIWSNQRTDEYRNLQPDRYWVLPQAGAATSRTVIPAQPEPRNDGG